MEAQREQKKAEGEVMGAGAVREKAKWYTVGNEKWWWTNPRSPLLYPESEGCYVRGHRKRENNGLKKQKKPGRDHTKPAHNSRSPRLSGEAGDTQRSNSDHVHGEEAEEEGPPPLQQGSKGLLGGFGPCGDTLGRDIFRTILTLTVNCDTCSTFCCPSVLIDLLWAIS